MKNSLVPKLRFKEFEGELIKFSLKEIVSFSSGGTPSISISEFWGGEIPWISAASMTEKYLTKSERTLTKLGSQNGTRIASKGELLLLVRGSMLFNRIPIGIAGVDVAFNQDVKSIKPQTQFAIAEYLYHWFLFKENILLGKIVVTGMGAGKLDMEDLNTTPVHLPSLPEQEKIASFLSAVDEKIAQLRRKQELLGQYKKGIMQQLFSGKLRFKDENGKNFPEWEEKKLGEVATIKSQKHNPNTDLKSYRCIELEHLTSNTGQLIGFIQSNESASIKNLFKKGDVLFGKLRPYLKKFLIAPFDGACSSEIWVLRGVNLINEFLFYLIQTEYFIQLANQSTGSKMPRADWQIISSGTFSIPVLKEQEKIASFLSSLDAQIELTGTQLSQTQVFKKGLLQQLFV